MLRRNKKEIWGCLCQTNNKHVFGIGKGKRRMWKGDISSLVKKQLINITMQTYPYQLISKPHKLIPSNSSDPTNITPTNPQMYTLNHINECLTLCL
jgi:hypothetical protein